MSNAIKPLRAVLGISQALCIIFLLFTCVIVSVSATAFAEDLSMATDPLPPGTFTTKQHSDEWKIKNALSAGPSWITSGATVVEMSMTMSDGNHKMIERVIRPGTNGWTCMPDVPGRPQHDPMCADETTMKWLRAVMEGRKPNIDRVGLSYILMGEARQGQSVPRAKDPSTVKDWYYVGPHVMIVLHFSHISMAATSSDEPIPNLRAEAFTPIPMLAAWHRRGERKTSSES